MADALDSLKQFIGIGYERPYQRRARHHPDFYDAGHVLGSALVALDIEDKDSGASQPALVFSGDLGRANRPHPQ
jgi:metallo-beta-lactamase family protein